MAEQADSAAGNPSEHPPERNFLLQLPYGVIAHVASFLPPGEAAYNLRPVCKAIAQAVRSKELLTILIGEKKLPVPSHALIQRWGRPGSSRGLTYKQRVQLLADAARGGDIDALVQLSRSTGCLVNEDVFRAAARADQAGVCEWLLKQECPLRDEGAWVLAVAAEAGNDAICELLHSAGLPAAHHAVSMAARAGHFDLAFWLSQTVSSPAAAPEQLRRAGMPDDLQATWWANAAYVGDNLYLMRVLKGGLSATPGDLPAVAHGCPLAKLQELLGECEDMSGLLTDDQKAQVLAGAATSPKPDWQDKVTWLLRQEQYHPVNTLDRHPARDFAALPDALQRLEWLAGQGFGLRDCRQLLRAAVEAGREELVGVMRITAAGVLPGPEGDGDGDDVNSSLVTVAVRHGHLGIARELLGRGEPVDVGGLLAAAGGTGRVDAVRFALEVMGNVEQGGEDGAAAATAAAAASSTETEPEGVRGQGSSIITSTYGAEVQELMKRACESGSLELVQWLRARGVGWSPGQLGVAAESGHVALVEWMVQQGYDMDLVGNRKGGWEQNGDKKAHAYPQPCILEATNCMRQH